MSSPSISQALQAQAVSQPAQAVTQFVAAANTAAATIHISEADTRKLIDEQLSRPAGLRTR